LIWPDSPARRAPGSALTATAALSELVGWVNRLPPDTSVESAVAKLSMPLAASASADTFALFAVSRATISDSFGALAAAARSFTSCPASNPAPEPRLVMIDTIGFVPLLIR
jgi:hypothetical protein